MNSAVLPKTPPGKWSIGLFVALVGFFVLSLAIVVLGHQTGGEAFSDNLYIAVPMFLAGLSGIAALVAGVIGILGRKERSVLVFLSAGAGLVVLFLVLGEFMAAH
jgi:hypothetical protein